MGKFKVDLVDLNKLKVNEGQIKGVPKNPRLIKNKDFKNLVNSILMFPKMLFLRPITYVNDFVVLGGNQRKSAMVEIAGMTFKEIEDYLTDSKEFTIKPQDDREEILQYWQDFTNEEIKQVPAQDATGISIAEMCEFVIKDNVGFGQDDWQVLGNHWDADKIKNWISKIPKDWKEVEDKTPSGENTTPFHQMTFTLSDKQVELIKKRLSETKRKAAYKETEFDNTNANANALYFILKNSQ